MSFDEIWIHIVAILREHAVKVMTGFVLMAVGWYVGKRRAKAHWTKQEFFDRLNVSLNTIDGGTLKIRTVSEKRCEEVFLNSLAADTVQKFARQTTANDPVLPIPLNDSWYFLKCGPERSVRTVRDRSDEARHGGTGDDRHLFGSPHV